MRTKILGLVLSSAILASTAGVAAADPYDHRTDVTVGVGVSGEVKVTDRRTQPQPQPEPPQQQYGDDHGRYDEHDGWGRGRGRDRDHRPAPNHEIWRSLATVRAWGRSSTVDVGGRALDQLELTATRGDIAIRKLIVVYTDGSRQMLDVNAQLSAGQSTTLALTGGYEKPVQSVTFRFGWQTRGLLSIAGR